MMRLILVSPPAVEPLTSTEAKARINVGSEVDDAIMEAYIMASRQSLDGADGWLGRALITQTWQAMLDQWSTEFADLRIVMPLPPIQSISSISYLDPNGVATVVDPASYQLVQGQRPYLLPAYGFAWPAVNTRANAITITFIAGYGSAGLNVPEPIRSAIALGCSNLSTMATRRLSVIQEIEEGIGATRYAVNTNPFAEIEAVVENLLSTYRVISSL
jgi:uncharacterized phiE125 gp8 family phage protein